ncbi:MAG: (2,3-dihydroxybenzoyl)adenylate synthase [Micromonosporaceae bacterium]
MLTGFTPWPEELAERYRREGYWRGEVFGDLLRDQAAGEPDRTAVVTRDGKYSYGVLHAKADRLAAGLAESGIRPGDRVVVQLPNTVDFVVVSVALFRLGALPVYALPAHRRAEITYLCRYAEAVALVVPDRGSAVDFRTLAREVVKDCRTVRQVLVAGDAEEFTALEDVAASPRELPGPRPEDVAFLLLSGGSTGMPKLIPRTHDDYSYQVRATAEAMGFTQDSAYLAALPVGHNAALGCPGVLGALRAGGRVAMAASPSPDEVFPLIAEAKATLTTLMPPVLALWLETAELFEADLSEMVIEVGGAMLSPEVARQVPTTLGARLSHWFGMAEGILCFTRLDDPQKVAFTTQGVPLSPADELRVVDDAGRDVPPGQVGQLLVRGPYTIRGYYNVPEHNRDAFTSDGFLRTGDLARIAQDGRLTVTGRTKDVINRGGEKISASEVEGHLVGHPKVRRAVLVAVADSGLGERSCAVVVPYGDPPTLEELRVFLRERGLADFKLPDRLEVVDALPQTGVGKIDKRTVASTVASGGQGAEDGA